MGVGSGVGVTIGSGVGVGVGVGVGSVGAASSAKAYAAMDKENIMETVRTKACFFSMLPVIYYHIPCLYNGSDEAVAGM